MVKIEFDITNMELTKKEFAVAEELLKSDSPMISIYKHIISKMAQKWQFSFELNFTTTTTLNIHIFTEKTVDDAFQKDMAWLKQELFQVLLDGCNNFELYDDESAGLTNKKVCRQRLYIES